MTLAPAVHSTRASGAGVPSLALALALALPPRIAAAAEHPGYPTLTREQVVDVAAGGSSRAPADLSSKDLTGLDLSHVDFHGANLSATFLDRANLRSAILSRCNLTVSFARGADFRRADLRAAEMFSMQLAGADFRGAILRNTRGLENAATRGARDVPAAEH